MKLLRIEGVNLAHCVEDTEDLSTRRGGSLMLLDAINEIDKLFGSEGTKQLRKISTGASTGLFELVDASGIVPAIRKTLAASPWCYGTFVVDAVDKEDFRSAETAAIAANRWRQMQSLSFSPCGLAPADSTHPKYVGVCAVDEVRPAKQTATIKRTSDTPVSDSVAARREYGLKAKQVFYPRILDTKIELKFCNDFEEIATGFNPDPAILEGKLAVFYADGNHFGDIARDCKTPGELESWDSYLKGERKALLAGLLKIAENTPRWRTDGDDKTIRLETPLWGGDELMFVVPGWCGMELAQRFFAQTETMRYPENADKPLTHACGLVFCHHQAPISRISAIARKLAEEGKKADRAANSLNWLVLESFDHAGGDLDEYLKRRFKPDVAWKNLALDRVALNALVKLLPRLKQSLPRSALVQITRAFAEGRAFKGENELDPLVKRARLQVAQAAGDETSAQDFKTLWKALHPNPNQSEWRDTGTDKDDHSAGATPDDLGAWLKLAELWDYCPNWNHDATPPGEAS